MTALLVVVDAVVSAVCAVDAPVDTDEYLIRPPLPTGHGDKWIFDLHIASGMARQVIVIVIEGQRIIDV